MVSFVSPWPSALRVSGKQNSLFSLEPVIKRLLTTQILSIRLVIGSKHHLSYTAKKPAAKIVNKVSFSRALLNFHVFAFPCERPIKFTLAKRNLNDFDWFKGTRMENFPSCVVGKPFCILRSSFTSIYCCISQKTPVASPASIYWPIPSGDH